MSIFDINHRINLISYKRLFVVVYSSNTSVIIALFTIGGV